MKCRAFYIIFTRYNLSNTLLLMNLHFRKMYWFYSEVSKLKKKKKHFNSILYLLFIVSLKSNDVFGHIIIFRIEIFIFYT